MAHEIRSGHVRSDQIRSCHAMLDQVRSGQIRSNQVKSDQIRSDQIRPYQTDALSSFLRARSSVPHLFHAIYGWYYSFGLYVCVPPQYFLVVTV